MVSHCQFILWVKGKNSKLSLKSFDTTFSQRFQVEDTNVIFTQSSSFVSVDDASGRYSTGWFWGNMYWVGSQSLCEHITPKKRVVINSQVSRMTFFFHVAF